MENLNLTVSHLPSLTWNRLGVNQAQVTAEAKEGAPAVFTLRGGAGMAAGEIGAADADRKLAAVAVPDRREAFVAGKTAIYQEQGFSTGLGAEFSDYMRKNAPVVRTVSVAPGAKLTEPAVLTWDFGRGGSDAARQLITVGDGAEATVLLVYRSDAEAEGISAVETDVLIGRDATLHLMKVNLLGTGFTHLDDTGAVIGDAGTLDFLQMEMGGARNWAGCYADERGKGANLKIRTGYAVNADHRLDLNYVAGQFGRKTVSAIDVKGVLADRAVKIFRGTIDFRNGSAGSVGDEQEDVLLLDEDVINKTVPVILCEEEDVDGRHGASIGRLSEDILFYLATRGIGEKEAQRLMLRGRLAGIARAIPDEETVKLIDAAIDRYGSDGESD